LPELFAFFVKLCKECVEKLVASHNPADGTFPSRGDDVGYTVSDELVVDHRVSFAFIDALGLRDVLLVDCVAKSLVCVLG
jgi:hypothetical protein